MKFTLEVSDSDVVFHVNVELAVWFPMYPLVVFIMYVIWSASISVEPEQFSVTLLSTVILHEPPLQVRFVGVVGGRFGLVLIAI